MGPFLFLYVALVGFFAFAALYHLILWWSSRRETLLAVFAVDCGVRAALSAALAAVATATTIAGAHAAIRARIAIGMLMMVTWLWSLSYVSGVRARWFVWPMTIFLLTVMVIHSFVMPLNSIVISVERPVMPWGETISNPQLGPQGWWVRPLYGLAIVITGFGLWCGIRLWARDRVAGALVVATACGTLLVFALEVLRSHGLVSLPFIGVIPQIFWVSAIAFLIARGHHRTREQLVASEQRFRGIFDQTFQFIGLMATDGTLIAANRTALEFAGIREPDAIGKPFWETPWWVHSPQLQDRLRQAVRDAAGGRVVRFEATHPRPDGKIAFVDFSLKPVQDERGEITLLIPEGRDITERKLAEQALRISQEQLACLFNASPLPEVRYGLTDGRILDVNQQFLKVFEISRDEAIGQTGVELGLWCNVAARDQLVARVRQDKVVGDFEARLRARSGREFDMVISAQVIELVSGPTVILQANDVTERKRAEAALRASEERFRALVEYGFEGINIIDSQGKLVYGGPGNEAVLGYAAEAMRGRSTIEIIHPDDLPEAQATWAGILQNPERVYTPRLRFRHRDGSWHWMEVTARNLLHHPAVRGVVVNWRDITERKRAEDDRRKLEAQLLHAQKLESLGVLAGGLAHDFNNLLTVMLGNASLSLTLLPEQSPASPMLREIEQAAQRAAELTQQMLAYSGKSKFVTEPLRLDDVVREMAKLLKTVVSKKATVELNLEPATIEGDVTQVRQVVMNLIINASDALEGNLGAIGVRTGVVQAAAADLRSPFVPDELPADAYTFVEVEDTGCGMNEETQAKIFDPFFTTKFTGRGLGLAAVIGIVRSHRGTIKVASTPGRGTAVRVLFPCAAAVASGIVDASREWQQPRGHGTVLVVDDEPIVHTFARRVLESAGFCVLTAEDGSEGLKVFGQHASEIVVVLLDLTMPRMDGLEVLRELRSLAPNVPVLLMSGYSDQDVSIRCSGANASGFIQKPFDPRELVARVVDLLPSGLRTG